MKKGFYTEDAEFTEATEENGKKENNTEGCGTIVGDPRIKIPTFCFCDSHLHLLSLLLSPSVPSEDSKDSKDSV